MTVVELAGIAVIVAGLAGGSIVFAVSMVRRAPFGEAYEHYRRNVGRGILLGLEFLVAADIIRTVVLELTFRSLGILGLIVVIRTFLSFTLQVEVHGLTKLKDIPEDEGGLEAFEGWDPDRGE